MRANRSIVALVVVLAGCESVAEFRPRGDGGWSESRRSEELGRLAGRAGVDFGISRAAEPAAPTTIDLTTALAMAGKGNRRISISQSELAGVEQQVHDARGRLLPSTVGSGRYTWYTEAQRNSIQLPAALTGGTPAGATSIKIRDADVGTLNGTITLPLDLSGELRHALAAAEAGYRGQEARLWATTLDQELAVVRAYFDLLEAERLRGVTEKDVALDREQLRNAEAKFQSGRLTKNQLLVFQVALQNAEQELDRRALAISQARFTLNQAIGADVNAPTEPADVTERPVLPSVEETLRVAYAENPLLRERLEEQQRLEETARSLARGRFPKLAAGAAIDYSNSKLLEPRDIGSGFVGFNWDLDTGGQREAEIAEARISVDRNRLEIERQLRELEAGIRATHQAAAERLSALATADNAVGQAEENLRIRREQFDVGRAQSEDVLDAQALLSAERATQASALYQAHVRLAELRSLMGRPVAGESPR